MDAERGTVRTATPSGQAARRSGARRRVPRNLLSWTAAAIIVGSSGCDVRSSPPARPARGEQSQLSKGFETTVAASLADAWDSARTALMPYGLELGRPPTAALHVEGVEIRIEVASEGARRSRVGVCARDSWTASRELLEAILSTPGIGECEAVTYPQFEPLEDSSLLAELRRRRLAWEER